jgi:hypothetical protein
MEIAAVTAVLTLVAFSHRRCLKPCVSAINDHAVCLPRASDSFGTTPTE